ncbi:hypothetical protein BAUCODRAFT_21021 [Baudoinia panamericana UAMH 10762]|uniref:Ig-like domain-containing protein n=1 Tax=Baudoinia panamericana (strain UAMH 10762) TaxID=717646 RepID=M2M1X0_BAUPA|nr:uncharacterized protein BAUCODRAFT_21021 [Baudoinia panamericana UAMH 10762]EMD01058.1 hypothetical protein BAUCODRAFT_21021 [Baudoinia panamericana UAMH 10762]
MTVLVTAFTTMTAASVCSSFPYSDLLPLSKVPAAMSFCSSRYPVACTAAPTTTNVKKGRAVTTSSTRTTSPTTLTTSTTTSANALATLFSKLQTLAAGIAKTACSCIETAPTCTRSTTSSTSSTTSTTSVLSCAATVPTPFATTSSCCDPLPSASVTWTFTYTSSAVLPTYGTVLYGYDYAPSVVLYGSTGYNGAQTIAPTCTTSAVDFSSCVGFAQAMTLLQYYNKFVYNKVTEDCCVYGGTDLASFCGSVFCEDPDFISGVFQAHGMGPQCQKQVTLTASAPAATTS